MDQDTAGLVRSSPPKKNNLSLIDGSIGKQKSNFHEVSNQLSQQNQGISGWDPTWNTTWISPPIYNANHFNSDEKAEKSYVQSSQWRDQENYFYQNARVQIEQRFTSSNYQNHLRGKNIAGIPNFSNTCFAGALLQCLYRLPAFKKEFDSYVKDLPQEIAHLVQKFFSSMDLGDSYPIYNSAYELITKLFDLRPQEFQIGRQGSSEMLFRVLIDEIGRNSHEKSSLVQLFWQGKYEKRVDCQKCDHKITMNENIFILPVKDIDYRIDQAKSLFQSQNEQRFCRKCQIQMPYNVSLTFESLPKILVIAISDTIENTTFNPLIDKISTTTKDESLVEYEFFAGVANTRKGSMGIHSLAIIKSSQSQSGYFEFNDTIVREISLDSVTYYPKLLFYQRIDYQGNTESQDGQIEKKELNCSQTPTPLSKSIEIPIPSISQANITGQMNISETSLQKSNPDYSPELRWEQGFGKRRALKTQIGTEFGGAVLQCLYHLPKFKALLYEYENKKVYVKTIASQLAQFFKSMDKSYASNVNQAADELIKFVSEDYQSQSGGKVFFQALMNALSRGESINEMPFLKLFGWKSKKITSCRICQQSQETPLSQLSPLNLQKQDYTNEINNNHFLTSFEPFRCKCHVSGQYYQRSVLNIDELPEIAVLEIEPGISVGKLLPRIRLKSLEDPVGQDYDYYGGVLTQYQYVDGDSIAIIQCGGNKDSYYKFGKDVEKTKLYSASYNPRLLFYCKSQ